VTLCSQRPPSAQSADGSKHHCHNQIHYPPSVTEQTASIRYRPAGSPLTLLRIRALTLKTLQGKYYECITPAVNSSSKLLCGCASSCVSVCAHGLEEIHQCNEHRSEDYEILMSVKSGFAMFCLRMNTHFEVPIQCTNSIKDLRLDTTTTQS